MTVHRDIPIVFLGTNWMNYDSIFYLFHSWDVATSNLHLFLKLKLCLTGSKFKPDEEVIAEIKQHFVDRDDLKLA